ncbi:tetratricopeptide repeat protein, partial [Patescibacteria group bacterium]|nr:tetratricopeptide repeat protein [Patescibacteria group bacterium]
IIFSLFLFTACTSKYKVEVDLTPEEEAEIYAEIEKLEIDIKTYDTNKESYEYWEESIPSMAIISLARAYEDLGDLGKAIDIYTDILDTGAKTRAIIHNLGRLYEKVGEYELAVVQYQRIIDEYFETQYLYDITWAYIRTGDRQNAEKYFNAWQLEFRRTDEQTQDAIKKLREAEQTSEL